MVCCGKDQEDQNLSGDEQWLRQPFPREPTHTYIGCDEVTSRKWVEGLPSIEEGHETTGKQTEPCSCVLPMGFIRVATLVVSIVRSLVLLDVLPSGLMALGGSLDAAPRH